MTIKQIWKQKIYELDQIIGSVEIGKDGRLGQLYSKREQLEKAFNSAGV